MARETTLPDTSSMRAGGGAAPRPYLVLALQYENPSAGSTRYALSGIQQVVIGRGDERRASEIIESGALNLRIDIADPRMSSDHARLMPATGTWHLKDAGSKNGTYVNGQRVEQAYLQDCDLVEIGRTMFVFRTPRVIGGLQRETTAASLGDRPAALRTMSGVFAAELETLGRVAGTDVPIAIYGPTGTGKELTARSIHQLSRRKGDFIAVNCGAIAATLVESELFGYKKGAFSGAAEDRPGLVRAADKGTLFLDEVAELPAAAQVALLRVLQESEVLPVGATAPIAVDIRVVTATHRDLATHVEDGSFREDLYARLSGHAISLPPLAERREDLGLLISDVLSRTGPRPFTRSAARGLFAYHWPRNIRELHRVLETAIAAIPGDAIELAVMPAPIRQAHDDLKGTSLADGRDAAAKTELIDLLELHKGNVTAAAKAMGKSRGHFHRLLTKFELDAADYR